MKTVSATLFKRTVTLDRQVPDFPAEFARVVESAVERGELAEDATLPSAEELAGIYNVSAGTIRSGLAHLVRRNILGSRRGPGGGYWVSKRGATLERLCRELISTARAAGNDDGAIASALRTALPDRLAVTEPVNDRREAHTLFGRLRGGVNDMAEHHNRYLDEPAH